MQPLFYAALSVAAGIAAAAGGSASWGPPAAVGAAVLLVAFRRRRLAAALGLAFCLGLAFARARWALRQPAPASALEHAAAELQPRPRDRIALSGFLRDTPDALYEDGRLSGVRLYSYPPRPATAPGNDDLPDAAPPTDAAWAAPLLALRTGQGFAADVHLRPLRAYHDPGVADFTAADRRQGIA